MTGTRDFILAFSFADFSMIFSGMILAGAGLTALLIMALMPVLKAYALARPNARSSHKVPTPQGGGIAVLAVTLAVAGGILGWTGEAGALTQFAWLAGAALFIAVIGALDDIRPLPVLPRFMAQIAAVTAAILMGRGHEAMRILPEFVPVYAEDAFLIFAGVWFVNLVNFMDGLDWLTVAEIVPVTMAFILLQTVGFIPYGATIIATALLGAMIGFAFFNKPVAKLFLGDVGSLPIGLILGWMLLQLAESGALTAALILPLYYLMDATITLFLRYRRGERLSQAHRSHFYQRATDNGHSVMAVVATVFALNIVLGLLAACTFFWPRLMASAWIAQLATLLVALFAVAIVLRRFAKPHIAREGHHA